MTITIDQETRQALEDIASARIIFGHHSVGGNLIAGLRQLAQEAEIDIRFVELESEQVPQGVPVFAHTSPGRNLYPIEKIDDFFSLLSDQHDMLKPDLALMKLCYVDVAPDTDTHELANHYEKKVREVRTKLGDTVVMHVTTPLMKSPSDLKSRIKRLIGKGDMVWKDAANKNRQDLNRKVVAAFPEGPIFDLALVESTGPDGRRAAHGEEGDIYYSLWPDYTEDGGHLNEVGRRVAAKAFALALAAALNTQKISE